MNDPGPWLTTPLRVAVLHGLLAPEQWNGPEAEREEINRSVSEVAEAIAQALRSISHAQVIVHGISRLHGLSSWLKRERVHVVFNVCEFLEGKGSAVYKVPALLERLGIPYTGNRAPTVRLSFNRVALKRRLLRYGIPTPPYETLQAGESLNGRLAFPLIVKVANEHASLGLDDRSVVWDEPGLREQVARVAQEHGWPVLVESYIEGVEVTASLVEDEEGLKILGLRQFDFSAVPPGLPHIITYRAKWETASEDYQRIRRGKARLCPEVEEEVRRLALRTFQVLGCRDYGRVDMRLDAAGRIFVIDVNPDCSLEIDSNWVLTALEEGHTYETALRHILALALRRGGKAHG